MKRNRALVQLIEMSKHLSFETQGILRAVEDELAPELVVSVVEKKTRDAMRYLALTSLPFSFDKMPHVKLDELWPVGCVVCKSVVRRKTMPTGNMQPLVFLVGDAPGVGDGEIVGRFDRMWVYGPSSHFLRRALLRAGIYHDCWFTNVLRCATPENRKSSDEEVANCLVHLKKEIDLLKPEKVILLGKHVQKVLGEKIRSFGVETESLTHPSFFVRNGSHVEEYARMIDGCLNGGSHK